MFRQRIIHLYKKFQYFIVFKYSERDPLPMHVLKLLDGDGFVEKSINYTSQTMPQVSTTMQVPSQDQCSLVKFFGQ